LRESGRGGCLKVSHWSNRGTSLALLATVCLVEAQAGAKHKPRDDPGDLPGLVVHRLHTSVTRVRGACISFDGDFSDTWHWVVAGDFFSRLSRVGTPERPVFRMGSEVVTDFPDELYIRAFSGVGRCSKDLKYLGPWPTANPDLVRGIRPEAAYVRDLHRYPIEISEIEDAPAFFGLTPLQQYPTWYYLWLVKTKGVRLTDSVVVDLSSKDGTSVGRFTVDLASPRSAL